MKEGKNNAHPRHIAMLLGNGYRPAPRVLKEARTLTQAGYGVTVIAWDREGDLPAREEEGKLTVRRVQNVRSSYGAGIRQLLRLPRFRWQQGNLTLNLDPCIIEQYSRRYLIQRLAAEL